MVLNAIIMLNANAQYENDAIYVSHSTCEYDAKYDNYAEYDNDV